MNWKPSLIAGAMSLASLAQAQDLEEDKSWKFGAPHLDFFTRSQSTTTKLPGYFIGFVNHQYNFSTDFDAFDGSLKSNRSSLFAPILPLSKDDWYLIALCYYTQNTFSSSIPNIISEDTLHSVNIPIALLKEINHEWIVGGMVMPSFNGDFQAGSNDAIAMAFGAGRIINPDFRLIGGVYYSHYYGVDTFYPGIQLIYRPCTDVEAYILGPIAGVSYSINDDWFVGVSARFSSASWKVKENDVLPDHIINYKRVNLAIRSEQRIYKNFWLSADVGISLAQNLKLEDLENNRLGESDVKPGPFATLSINYRY
ncbi:DUF6268 family outer membrane beta-barrel protein [Rubritalea marina]|uniref:DUF6268 family outer membrane beta-barrel protein n=1 Tax=Rubritalea marina TaxID=361055 RepID=UPI0012E9DEA8|nr:DUF6268 family outer membrane beta-barrel protein [Rubritalea marina]